MFRNLIEELARGRFSFLRPRADEIRRVLPRAEEILPEPQQIFFEDETQEPLVGFPVLMTPKLEALENAAAETLGAEEEAQLAYERRGSFNSRSYAASWERYSGLLSRALENVTLAGHGGEHSAAFWLHHSLVIARHIQGIPRRLRRLDLARGRDHGDAIKYRVYEKWSQRAGVLSHEVARRLATELGEDADDVYPDLLDVMRSNILIFTEDHISPDLSELGSYFRGLLGEDGRELRQRLAAVERWHAQLLERDAGVRSAARHLLGADPDTGSRGLLLHSGYLSFLSSHGSYDEGALLSRWQVELWEGLLVRLKEFEILHALRRMMVPLVPRGDGFELRDQGLSTTWIGSPAAKRVSTATRPLDFLSPWVVDPRVERFGLVYDITDFSAILSRLARAEKGALEQAFRMTTSFQHRVNKLARDLDLRLEKYLGDGAFYSSRNPRRALSAAIHLQRLYPEMVRRGFPFNRGMRIALNYGEYRLLPLTGGRERGLTRSRELRYEFFGQGLVELSRLSTGKRTQEIEDFKTYLLANGYPPRLVDKFFAPMTAQSSELLSKLDEARPFYAYINPNGALVNEGIVATEGFVSRLGEFPRLGFVREGGHGFIALVLEEDGEPLQIGLRKIGIGRFKGLEPMPIYEGVDGARWDAEEIRPIQIESLLEALEKLFASTVTARARAAKA